MLDENRVLAALPPAVAGSLERRLHLRPLTAGDVLFATGERIGHIYFPRSGAISLVAELSTGETIETAMIGQDGMVGGSAVLDDRARYKAMVQLNGSGYVLDMASARALAKDSEPFRATIAHHENLILAQAQQSAACNAVHSIDQRLARWLLRIRDLAGSNDFTLTQEFMADMLGVRRTSVTLAAQTLRQTGVVDYRRGRITIVQPDELQRQACECYSTVKTHYDRSADDVVNQAATPTTTDGAHGARDPGLLKTRV